MRLNRTLARFAWKMSAGHALLVGCVVSVAGTLLLAADISQSCCCMHVLEPV